MRMVTHAVLFVSFVGLLPMDVRMHPTCKYPAVKLGSGFSFSAFA